MEYIWNTMEYYGILWNTMEYVWNTIEYYGISMEYY